MKKKISTYILLLGVLLIIDICCKKEEKPPDPVTDVEGNTYKTVRIGNQVWMAENLKTTKFNDGTDIPLITNDTTWENTTAPGYCWYNNDMATYRDTYGAIYNGFTADTAKICPAGWHVPAKEEWDQLRTFLGDTVNGGGKLKEAGTVHWLVPNKEATNISGFTALPAGIRYFEGSFASILHYTCYWSSADSSTIDQLYISLYYGDAIFNISHSAKTDGFSIRCLKD